ncbi:hypothetical protein EV356DRAFT_454334 [Viridothelium virens]|uniref:Phytase-like domain-containing protein n=1 Tax=Viridothelium virens TaxID=1048519 RepID=A0A6A6GXB6_VIRVR|nr:hypothetical protein EV356DRAFT_454334 [Viridothelium virens]
MASISTLVAFVAFCSLSSAASASSFVNQTTCSGKTYTYQQLAGYGFIPSDARDKFGDTIGGIGSSIALDRSSWRKTNASSYTGTLWTLPDRGWNTNGTLNFQPRVHKIQIDFTPMPNASVSNPAAPNLVLTYRDTVAFTGPDGTPLTGLDADFTGHLTYPNFPDLPKTTFTGNGFGGLGPGGIRIPADTEGLVLGSDGSFWVSDEYGPYIYHFSSSGSMLAAIRPSDAYIPMRNNTESFSADSPPLYDPSLEPIPADNPSGRDNNQGFEGLTASPDGTRLYALLQSALNQEGGLHKTDRRYARLVEYDISNSSSSGAPVYVAEYVVPLPLYDSSGDELVAAQSEIHYLSPTQFIVLARDSNAGRGQSSSLSLYRHADVFDIANATDVKGADNDAVNGSIASGKGKLHDGVVPATYCSFLDYNVNAQLNRFGLHNGGNQDGGLLNEKWESLALAPVDGEDGADGEFFLFSLSDNDFITQNGYLNNGTFRYADGSGANLDNQALVFQISLPQGDSPLVS